MKLSELLRVFLMLWNALSVVHEGSGSGVRRRGELTTKSSRVQAEEQASTSSRPPTRRRSNSGKKSSIHPEAEISDLRVDLSETTGKRKSTDEAEEDGQVNQPGNRVEPALTAMQAATPLSQHPIKRQRSAAPVVAEVFEAIGEGRESMRCRASDDDAIRFLKQLYQRLEFCERGSSAPKQQLLTVTEFIAEDKSAELRLAARTETLDFSSSAAAASASHAVYGKVDVSSVSTDVGDFLPIADEFWLSSQAASRLPSDWHCGFFVQLAHLIRVGGVRITEEVLLDYLQFLAELFTSKEGLFRGIKDAFYPTMKRCYRGLLNSLFKAVEGVIDPHSGKPFLLQHLKNGVELGLMVSRENWQAMAVDLVDRFGDEIYERRLRIRDFYHGLEHYSHDLFMHFAPLLRLLRCRSEAELAAERFELNDFFAFQLANREIDVPMGRGGLLAIEALVKQSKALITTFTSEEEWKTRAKCVRLMFDELFGKLNRVNLLRMLHNYQAVALFELTLAFSTDSDEFKVFDLLQHLLRRPKYYFDELLMIMMLVAYADISNDDWAEILNGMRRDELDLKVADIARSLHRAIAEYPRTSARLAEIQIQLNKHMTALNGLSDAYKLPVEFDFIRLLLARRAGLPLWETKFVEFCGEGVEWVEAAGFGNEHLKRVGEIYGQAVPRITILPVNEVEDEFLFK